MLRKVENKAKERIKYYNMPNDEMSNSVFGMTTVRNVKKK